MSKLQNEAPLEESKNCTLVATIEIGGMTCGSCVATIESVLSNMDGVVSSSVNLAAERGVVHFDPNHVTVEEIVTELCEMEYPSTLLYVDDPRKQEERTERVKLIIDDLGHQIHTTQTITEVLNTFSPNVLDIKIESELDTVTFKYNPIKIGIRSIMNSLKENHIEAKFPNKFAFQTPNSRETQKLYRLFIWSVIFGVPLFIITTVLPSFAQVDILQKTYLFSINISIENIISLICGSIIQFIIGSKFYIGAYKALLHKEANMDVLVCLATSCAYFYSVFSVIYGILYEDAEVVTFFDTSGLLIAFIIMGKYLEARAKGQTVTSIQTLVGLQPQNACLVDNENGDSIISIDLLQIKDVLRVGAGEKVPTDGVILSGVTSIDESMLTGESLPVPKGPGSEVIGGTINTSGVFQMNVTKIGESTGLAQIIKLVQDAQGNKAPIQRFADQAARIFVPIVIVLSLVTFGVWMSLTNTGVVTDIPDESNPFLFSLLFCISVVIIACPCALGLATPTAVMVGTGVAAKNGILIKGGPPLEIAHQIDVVIFDKTGTLTHGSAELTHWAIYLDEYEPEEYFKLVLSIEIGNPHPFSKAICEYIERVPRFQYLTRNQTENIYKVTSAEYLPGRGIVATIKSQKYFIGNLKLLEENQIPISLEVDENSKIWKLKGNSIVYVASSNKVIGSMAFEDQIKETAQEAVNTLKNLGVFVYLVSGDSKQAVQKVADKVQINNVYSEVSPIDKRDIVKNLQESGSIVAFVGDGINDSPALAQADVGIAIGAGTDVALDSADIILVKSELIDVYTAIDLSRVIFNRIKLNYVWALIYNILGIPIAAGALYPLGISIPPLVAGLLMAFSSVSVVISSLMLKRYKKPNPSKAKRKKSQESFLSDSQKEEEEDQQPLLLVNSI